MQKTINSIHTEENNNKRIEQAKFKGMFFCILFFCALEAIVIIFLYKRQVVEIPYVIEINREGDIKYKKDIAVQLASWSPSTATKIKTICDYITNLRSICLDEYMQVKMIKDVYAFSVENAMKAAEEYLISKDPISKIGKERIEVDVYSVLPMLEESDDLFQLDWNEKTYSQSGALLSEQNYRAIIKTKHFLPKTRDVQQINPAGIYISDLKISIIKDGYTINENK